METITANNVLIIDPAFYMPQLGRTRRIWLYLPADYHTTDKHYPVVYMHDGQNLFDANEAFGEAWQIGEIMDALKAGCIIVGIDNGREMRMTEYNFHHHKKFGKGEGKQYVEFIVHTLKPHIDKTYRTEKSRDSTFTVGSSMGGLISFFAALYYPGVFGGAGIFSPSFWLVPGLKDDIKEEIAKKGLEQRFYFYAGGREGAGMIENITSIARILDTTAQYRVHAVINPEGEHTEATWRSQIPDFYAWMQYTSPSSRYA
jgi:predicted alpha/beta superfamily hydrolase